MASQSVREQIIGAWELIEYSATLPNDPSNKYYPMGPKASGIIMYTPDGFMSAQLQTPGQGQFDTTAGTEAEWAQVGRSYVAYTGHFWVDEKGDEQGRPILKHQMRQSNLPRLRGDIQRRLVRFSQEPDGKYLVLGVDGTMNFNGEERVIQVRWRRLPHNEAPAPPAKL